MDVLAALKSPYSTDSILFHGVVALRGDGKVVALVDSRPGDAGHVVSVWDVAEPRAPKLLAHWETSAPGSYPVGSAAFLADDRLAIVRDSEVRIERLPSGEATDEGSATAVAMRGGLFVGDDAARAVLAGIENPIMYGLLASPDGRFVAMMNRNREAGDGFILDLSTGKQARKLPRRPLAFSADGRLLAAYVRKHVVGLFERDHKWKPRGMTIGPFDYSFHATLSPDGARLLVVGKAPNEPRGQYRPITVWDLATGARIGDHEKSMRAFAWLGDRVVLGLQDDGNAQILAVP